MIGPLALALFAVGASAEPVRVALDLGALDDASFAAIDGVAIERGCLARLVQEGFAVVALDHAPELVLVVEVAPEHVDVVATQTSTSTSPQRARVVRTKGLRREELMLELVQKAVELARDLTDDVLRRRASRAITSHDATVTATITETPRARERDPRDAPLDGAHLRAELGARVGATARAGGVDASAAGWLDGGGVLFGRGELALVFAPSSDVVAIDATLRAGPGLRVALGDVVALEALVLGGLVVHAARLDGASTSALAASAALVAGLELRARPWLVFGLWCVPSVASRSFEHIVDGRVAWRRGVWAVEVGAGLAVEL